VIDPDNEFLLVVPPPDREFQKLALKILELPWTGIGKLALELYQESLKFNLSDLRLLQKISLLLYDGLYYQEALANFKRLTTLRESDTTHNMWLFYDNTWQGMLLDLLGERQKALAHYRIALETGIDIPIKHSQYDLTLNRSFVEKCIKVPFKRDR